MFQAGQQIGIYKLVRKLAKGGFGEVWLAEKQSEFVTKKFAVKLPLDEQVDFEAIRQEATLWEQASGHPNVLPLIDADVYDGQVAIVSEYAEGGSLADRLKYAPGGRLPVAEAVETTVGILNGLDYLHSKNIIHRDVKPANILLQGDTPRLTDFGISRAIHTSQITSVVVGTESYMAPEAFEGVRSVQTDIWSVGVVLYRLLSGRLPFPQLNPSEIMYSILENAPDPLPPEIPEPLQKIVFRALEKDRDLGGAPPRRYQTALAMREDLLNFLETYSPALAPAEAPVLEMPETEDPTRVKLRIPLKREDRWELGQVLTRRENLPFVILSVILIFFAVGWLTVRLFGGGVTTAGRPGAAAANTNVSDPATAAAAGAQPNANSNAAGADANASLSPRAQQYVKQGYEFFRQNKYNQAIDSYTKAIGLHPDDYSLYNDRGLVYLAAGRHDRAITDFNKSIELDPNKSDTYNNRGFAYQNKGDREKAVADYRRALEIDPQNELATKNLNEILK